MPGVFSSIYSTAFEPRMPHRIIQFRNKGKLIVILDVLFFSSCQIMTEIKKTHTSVFLFLLTCYYCRREEFVRNYFPVWVNLISFCRYNRKACHKNHRTRNKIVKQ